MNKEEDIDFLQHVGEQLRIALPVCFSLIMRKSIDIVSVVFIGQLKLSTHFLSAAGLASVTANVTGYSLVIGFANALSTLCSQAKGANNINELMIVLQRGIIIILTTIFIPVSILWIFSANIMIGLGQENIIALLASEYLITLIPALFATSISICIQNWLFCQSKTDAMATISFIITLLHPFWCYFFIYWMNLGYLGAAVAISTAKLTELLLLLLYISVFSNILNDLKFKFSSEIFENWIPFIKLGLPNILMMSEWWASEIIIFLSGCLLDPEIQVSSMSIYQLLITMCFTLPSGFRVSATTLTGNALGASKAKKAQIVSLVAPLLAMGFSSVLAIVLISFPGVWGSIFTQEKSVLQVVKSLVPLLAMYIVLDGVQTALTGVLTGLGKQRVAGPIVLFSYYIIAIPVSLCCGMQWGLDWKVYGLCLGTLLGTAVHMCLVAFVVYVTTDWKKEAFNVQNQQQQQLNNNEDREHKINKTDDAQDVVEDGIFFCGDKVSRKKQIKIEKLEDMDNYNNSGSNSFQVFLYKKMFGSLDSRSEYELVTQSLSEFHFNNNDDDNDDENENFKINKPTIIVDALEQIDETNEKVSINISSSNK